MRTWMLTLLALAALSGQALAQRFNDVSPDSFAAAAIDEVARLGLMSGDSKGNFRPTASVTRAELAVILVRLLALSPSTGAENQIAALRQQVEALQARVTEFTTTVTALRQQVDTLGTELAAVRQAQADAGTELAALEGRVAAAEATQTQVTNRFNQLEASTVAQADLALLQAAVDTQLESFGQRLATAEQALGPPPSNGISLGAQVQTLQAQAQSLLAEQPQLTALGEQVQRHTANLDQARERLNQVEAINTAQAAVLNQLQVLSEGHSAAITALVESLTRLGQTLTALVAQLAPPA